MLFPISTHVLLSTDMIYSLNRVAYIMYIDNSCKSETNIETFPNY